MRNLGLQDVLYELDNQGITIGIHEPTEVLF